MPRLPPASLPTPAAVLARKRTSAAVLAATASAVIVGTLFCAPVLPRFSSLARADEATVFCTREPREHWMSAAAISEKAVRAGYPDVRHVKVVGTCYEIEALTAHRMQADVVMDPVTGDVVQAWMGRLPE